MQYNDRKLGWRRYYVGKNAVTTYIRPQRYTKEFVDANDTFTISFFDESYRKALNICGSVSGRDKDKIKEAGLTPYFVDGTAAFEEANLIFSVQENVSWRRTSGKL